MHGQLRYVVCDIINSIKQSRYGEIDRSKRVLDISPLDSVLINLVWSISHVQFKTHFNTVTFTLRSSKWSVSYKFRPACSSHFSPASCLLCAQVISPSFTGSSKKCVAKVHLRSSSLCTFLSLIPGSSVLGSKYSYQHFLQ